MKLWQCTPLLHSIHGDSQMEKLCQVKKTSSSDFDKRGYGAVEAPKYDVLKKSLHISSILITFKELWLYFASNSSACVKYSSKRTVLDWKGARLGQNG